MSQSNMQGPKPSWHPDRPTSHAGGVQATAADLVNVCAATQQNMCPPTQWARNRYKNHIIWTRRNTTQTTPKSAATKCYAQYHFSDIAAMMTTQVTCDEALKFTNRRCTTMLQTQKSHYFVRSVVNSEKTFKEHWQYQRSKIYLILKVCFSYGNGNMFEGIDKMKNIIIKITLVLIWLRAHHEADVRQVTRIVVIKLTRAKQIIHHKMGTSRIVLPSNEK